MRFLPLALAGLALLVVAMSRKAPFPLRLALAGYVGFWLVIPFAFRLLVRTEPVGEDMQQWYHTVVLTHAVTVVLIVTLALTIPSPFTAVIGKGRLAHWMIGERVLCLGLIACGAVVIGARLWQFRAAGGDFLGLVSVNISLDREEIGGFTLVSALGSGYISVCMAVLAIGGRVSLRTRLIGFGCVTAVAIQSVLTGQRSYMLVALWGLLLLAGTAEPERRSRMWLVAVSAIMIAAFVLPTAAVVLGVTRMSGNSTVDVDVGGSALETLAQLDRSDRLLLFATAASVKFDGIVTGAALLSRDGVGGGGLRPLTSALLSPIPRLLLPSKPVPISANGEQSGVPYVRAAERFGRIEYGMVVPVSPAIVTIWELGWPGVVIFVVINVFALWLIEAWLLAGGLVPATFAFSVLSYPSFEFLLQGPSSLVRDGLRLVLAWIALTVIAVAYRGERQSDVVEPSV